MTVDTLSIARELKAATLPDAQAGTIAAVIGRSTAERLTTAASKADVAMLKAKIEQFRPNFIMWFVATNLTMAAVVSAAAKL